MDIIPQDTAGEPDSPPGAGTAVDKLPQLLGYCYRGWRLLPCWWLGPDGHCACLTGERCDRPGKHPRISWQNPLPGRPGATRDPGVVTEWHRVWPDANWAVVMDGMFVVDVDVKHGGMGTLAALETPDSPLYAPDLLGATLTQRTVSGGRQFFYRQPAEGDITSLAQGELRTLPGFEVKGLRRDGAPGSYVVVPPSQGRDWLGGAVRIADPPPLLLHVLRRARDEVLRRGGAGVAGGVGGAAAGRSAFDWDAALTPGAVLADQQGTLYRAALSLRAQGVNDALAGAVLRRVVECFTNTDERDPWELRRGPEMWERIKRERPPGRTESAGGESSRDTLRRWRSAGGGAGGGAAGEGRAGARVGRRVALRGRDA